MTRTAAALLLALTALQPAVAQPPGVVGAWRLISYDTRTADGVTTYPLGPVTHHLEIASAPNYVGMDLVRTFSISGNRLTLTTPQRTLAGQTSTSTLIWERLD